ncbi:MAG: hypothetical protein R3E53_04010 [Myxococcota bacterium]
MVAVNSPTRCSASTACSAGFGSAWAAACSVAGAGALDRGVAVALPLVAGYLSRRWILAWRGRDWFEARFLRILSPVTILALLTTLVRFLVQGRRDRRAAAHDRVIAVPLVVQTLPSSRSPGGSRGSSGSNTGTQRPRR